ncbi:uncharacterized protein LOC132300298 [Cornus florida]|uniref:uncharacterized protein LOC132300298 n=1 Tax=Cornus florida TaxID=4283 RepID=UPI00289B7E5A|nr:uncharacterized protein LOC132300298 [Cornus florida]
MEGDGSNSETRPQPSGGPRRKGRGKAKNVAQQKAKGLYGKDVPVQVEFGTGYIKPVGKNNELWTAEVGIHTRDKEALLNFKTWRDIPEFERQVCYGHFKEIFAMDAHANEIDFKRVTNGVSESLRKYRHRLKNHFDKYLPIENARLHPYVGIHTDLWKNLCDWWISPEFQKISQRNKANRSKNEIPHVSRSMSFVRRYDAYEKESQQRQREEDGEVQSHWEGLAIRLYKETF